METVRINKSRGALSLVCGWCGVWGTLYTLKIEGPAGNSALSVLLFLIYSVAAFWALGRRCDKRKWLCALAVGLFMGLTLALGKELDTTGGAGILSVSVWLAGFALAAFLTPLWAGCFSRVEEKTKVAVGSGTVPAPQDSRKKFLLSALGLFLVWMPVFLAVFPGFFAYDATDQLEQVMTGQYVTRHPLLHTLLLGNCVAGFYRLTGNYNVGIAVYTLGQMAGMAFVFAWLLGSLEKLGAPKRFLLLAFLYLAFFPVIPMFVLCSSKDTPYCAGLLAVSVLLCFLYKDRDGFFHKKGNVLGLGAALFVTAHFRNNGFYVFLLTVPLLFSLAKKADWRRVALLSGGVLILCLGTNTLLKRILVPEDTGAQETLTVPIQQLARTWNDNPAVFTARDQDILFEILPREALKRYDPKLSDMVKIDFDSEAFAADPLRYASLWLRIAGRAPGTYLNAWLMTSYGFWYPDTVIDVYNGQRYYSESSYFSCETEPPGTRRSCFPLLEKCYQKLSWTPFAQKIPVVSMLFSPGFLCWLYVLAGLLLIALGRYKQALLFGPVFVNWLTVLLGPTYLVRYVLIFWFALPLLATVVMNGKVWYTSREKGSR